MAVYTTIDDPSAYFQTTLYSGTGSQQSITNGGNSDLQPDWLWIKERTGTSSHQLVDSVRGYYLRVESDNTSAELDAGQTGATYQNVTSFDSDGFGVKNGGAVNASGDTYVAWQWKAGTSFTNDASSTGIGTIDSTGSVNDTAGFSICSYTGTGSNGTIKHGLSTKPNVILVKKRASGTANWNMQHTGINTDYQTDYILLDTNAGSGDEDTKWNDTAPTTSVFSVGDDGAINNSGDTYISYIFSNRQGYSKFGSYTGNGNSDGAMIFTGLESAWVMIKQSSAAGEGWHIFDNKREGYNVDNDPLVANTSNAEGTSDMVDITSNGFKCRTDSEAVNQSGATYVYMAFAKSPFVNSNGVPNNAR